jgi:PAS domain S-box-containing protein
MDAAMDLLFDRLSQLPCTRENHTQCEHSLLNLIAANVKELIFSFDRDGRITYASPSARSLGYEPADLRGRAASDMIHPDDYPKARKGHMTSLRGAPNVTRDERTLRVKAANGDWIWFEGDPHPLRQADGDIVGSITILRDVTERLRMEEMLRDRERNYRILADNITDTIVKLNLKGEITYASPSIEALTGYSPEEVVGADPIVSLHGGDTERLNEAGGPRLGSMADALAGSEAPGRVRYQIRCADGHSIWAESAPRLLRDDDGGPLEILTVIRDVTDQVAAEAALKAAQEDAEAAALTKAQFLANMSHEIRTPLTAVLGYVGLLQRMTGLPELAQGHLDRVAGAGQSLLAIVNDVLDFSKLEAGHFQIQPRPSNVCGICAETAAIFGAQATAKSIELVVSGCDALPDLLVDPDRLRQVLINLIGNAVKFTTAGKVSLSCAWADERLALTIADTGPGMDDAAVDRLFQRFSQVGGAFNTNHGGTGLGLAITRGLVEAMGGSIGVVSALGLGSTFRVEIPAPAVVSLVEEESEETLDLTGVRVLIVDDNATNRDLASRLIDIAGALPCSVGSGQDALGYLAVTPVDLVLLDQRMPGMDGPETLRRFRAAGGPNAGVPVLLFTADAEAGCAGLPDGFAGLVRKPLEPTAFFGAILAALAAGRPVASSNAGTGHHGSYRQL